jgi:hypothetical protein
MGHPTLQVSVFSLDPHLASRISGAGYPSGAFFAFLDLELGYSLVLSIRARKNATANAHNAEFLVVGAW